MLLPDSWEILSITREHPVYGTFQIYMPRDSMLAVRLYPRGLSSPEGRFLGSTSTLETAIKLCNDSIKYWDAAASEEKSNGSEEGNTSG